MNSMKKITRTSKNQPLSTWVVQKYYYTDWTNPIPRQGWFFKLNFHNGISRNTGMCKLGRFLLRQSHMSFDVASDDNIVQLVVMYIMLLMTQWWLYGLCMQGVVTLIEPVWLFATRIKMMYVCMYAFMCVCICGWACKNEPSEYKKLWIFSSFLYYNLIHIYTELSLTVHLDLLARVRNDISRRHEVDVQSVLSSLLES